MTAKGEGAANLRNMSPTSSMTFAATKRDDSFRTSAGGGATELRQQGPQHVNELRPLTHDRIVGTVQERDALLRLGLDRDEPHGRTRDRLTDRGGIDGV